MANYFDYQLVQSVGSDPDVLAKDLATQVRGYLRQGWILSGGVAVVTGIDRDGNPYTRYLQAITRQPPE